MNVKMKRQKDYEALWHQHFTEDAVCVVESVAEGIILLVTDNAFVLLQTGEDIERTEIQFTDVTTMTHSREGRHDLLRITSADTEVCIRCSAYDFRRMQKVNMPTEAKMQQATVVALEKQGVSLRKIAEKTGLNYQKVNRLLHKNEACNKK